MVSDCNSTQLAEVVFIVDSSSSIGDDEYIKMKDFIAAMTDGFVVGPNAVRVGTILFSSARKVTIMFYIICL